MEAKSELEKKELVKLENRFLTLTSAVTAYKDNPKALKLILKLVKIEAKAVKDSKAPVPVNDLHALTWRYDDLTDIIKRLTKTKQAEIYARAARELDDVISKTEREVAELTYVPEPEPEVKPTAGEKAKEFAQKVSEGAQKLGDKARSGAEKLGDAVGGVVEEAIESIKNVFTGGDN